MTVAAAWLGQVREAVHRARRERLFRDAFWILVFSTASKLLLFFGTAHASRCLGPVNMGISAQVQVMAQQMGLAGNGGLDQVAVRVIARDPRVALPTLRRVVGFRLALAALLAAGWLALLPWFTPAGPVRQAWMLGSVLLVAASLNSGFCFQGVQRLPLYTAVVSAGSAATALCFLLAFHPGMPLGSDLAVSAAVAIVVALTALALAPRVAGAAATPPAQAGARDTPAAAIPGDLPAAPDAGQTPAPALGSLLRSGWRYWLLAGMVYLYSGLPLLLISHYVDDRSAGVYRVAFLMAAGVEMLFNSINSLLLPRLVAWRQEGLSVLWSRQSGLLAMHVVIGLAAALAAAGGGPWFFARFLGVHYAESVPLFQVLVGGRVVVFVGQVYAYGLVALHLDSEFLAASLAGAVVSLALNLALVPVMGAMAAALTSVASELAVVTGCYLLERRHVLAHT